MSNDTDLQEQVTPGTVADRAKLFRGLADPSRLAILDGTLRIQLEMAERERDREREERNREREQMQATIDDLRTRLDRAESRIAGLLPTPPVRQGRWRLWGGG